MTGTAEQVVLFLMGQDKEKQWDLTEHKEKRSLNANSYFHVLADKIRQTQTPVWSMAYVKNHLITDYGQIEYLDGSPMIFKTNAPEDYMMENETIHTKCVKVSEENGKPVYFYRIYRGSHTYNSEEMAKLIDGAIQEARNCGIPEREILTPNEVAKLIAKWGDAKEKEGEGNGKNIHS